MLLPFCAAENASDAKQLGTIDIPQQGHSDWIEDVPEAWRKHMGSRLTKRKKSGLPSLGSLQSASGGWTGARTIPLDQANVSTVLQSGSDEKVRKQVCSLCTAHFDIECRLVVIIGDGIIHSAAKARAVICEDSSSKEHQHERQLNFAFAYAGNGQTLC